MIKSKLTGKIYDSNNTECLFCTNPKQAYLYLRNEAELLDILYTDTKNNSLVFVFHKNEHLKELYQKWLDHTLN